MLTKGFTLLEILIALLIFIIISVATTSALYIVFSSRDKVNAHATQLASLQIAFSIIERDIKQFEQRRVLVNQWQYKPALFGQANYLEFTRGGSLNPLTQSRHSSLQRIAFVFENHRLIRRQWPRLDTPNDKIYTDTILLTQLDSLQFAYLDSKGSVLQKYNNQFLTYREINNEKRAIPKAIQINLVVKHWGKMSLLFVIPEGVKP